MSEEGTPARVIFETMCGCTKVLTAPDLYNLPESLDLPLEGQGREVDDITLLPLFHSDVIRSFRLKSSTAMAAARGSVARYVEVATLCMRKPSPPETARGKQVDQIDIPWDDDYVPAVRRRLHTLCGCVGTADILIGHATSKLNHRAVTMHTPAPVYEMPVYPAGSIMKGLSAEPLRSLVSYQNKRRFKFRAINTEGPDVYVDYDELGWC